MQKGKVVNKAFLSLLVLAGFASQTSLAIVSRVEDENACRILPSPSGESAINSPGGIGAPPSQQMEDPGPAVITEAGVDSGPRDIPWSWYEHREGKLEVRSLIPGVLHPDGTHQLNQRLSAKVYVAGDAAKAILALLKGKVRPEGNWWRGKNVSCFEAPCQKKSGEQDTYVSCHFQLDAEGAASPDLTPEGKGGGSILNAR